MRARAANSSASLLDPFIVPSPPMVKTRLTPAASIASQICAVSCPPRDEPSIEPASRWIVSTSARLSGSNPVV